METLPDEYVAHRDQELLGCKVGRSSRRRHDHDAMAAAHVVVTTAVVKPKPAKPESKKLRKKLTECEQEKQSLAQAIHEKNQEISDLKKSVDSLNEVLNSVPIDELRCNSSIAGTKILELSKKNRQMRSELEQAKSRLGKKDSQIEKLEKELRAHEEKLQHNQDLLKKGCSPDELQAKINSMQQKLFETRNRNTELQSQLKLAQKCLQHEIGESCNINILANNLNQANWRGRAQQIIALNQKVQELKARLDFYEDRAVDRAEYAPVPLGSDLELVTGSCRSHHASSERLGGGDGGGATTASFDRFTPGVRKSEILHRAKVEALEKEILSLQSQLEDQRNKTLALKVRNKNLNEEMNKYKIRYNELEEQTDFNGANINTMNDKLNRQRVQYESRLDDMRGELVRVTEERDLSRRQMEELSGMHLELQTVVKQKDVAMASLQDMIKKLEMDLRALSGGFLFSCREFRKEEFVGILDALEVEKNQLMLLTKTLGDRLETERAKNEAAQEQIGKLKARISRLEVKIRDLEKELDVQSDKKKRTQRMADYASSLSRTSLNGSIGSFCFESQSQYQSTTTLNSAGQPEARMEDLKNSLELAKEKITMLTEKLEYITEEKNADAKFFEDTINSTKTIILETVLGAREKGSSDRSKNADKTTSEISIQ
ncbi:coiled-coil domain-containing protein 13 [Drosophila sechellia]|uniref:GM25649 n=1 Tax=Drosophila sechellia TaxID=7238 RepID=B4HJR5_DROSE|nr:coiled-coil domain-containing protein 13 [Drosophila sechellia]EDW41792.1 GM25649 [Drosophila sechellia]